VINISGWISRNWVSTVPIVLSVVAIIFTATKDFIIPLILKPKLDFTYCPKEPYKRGPVIINPGQHHLAFFDRFKIENIGRNIAKNCRCQIFSVVNSKNKEFDFHGYPLRWASRPESAIDFTKAERLNIASGESEFVDLAYFRSDAGNKLLFNKYHNVDIGMPDNLDLDDYIVQIIVSGDNFRPYLLTFRISKKLLGLQGLDIKLLEVKRK